MGAPQLAKGYFGYRPFLVPKALARDLQSLAFGKLGSLARTDELLTAYGHIRPSASRLWAGNAAAHLRDSA